MQGDLDRPGPSEDISAKLARRTCREQRRAEEVRGDRRQKKRQTRSEVEDPPLARSWARASRANGIAGAPGRSDGTL
jgi:hypothetical protein